MHRPYPAPATALAFVLAFSCGSPSSDPAARDAAAAPAQASGADSGRNVAYAGQATPPQVARVVEEFGRRLARVSLQAPRETVQRDLRSAYGELVTDSLLSGWLSDPTTAPGRDVSSPWPDRIEILGVRRVAQETFQVRGEIVYVTSTGLAPGAAEREPVVLDVARDAAGKWSIVRLERERVRHGIR
jgi:hypothetical protein